MPNPIVHIEFAMPDPNEAPLNLIQLFTLANKLASGEIEGSFLPYIVQSGTPDVSNQDKVWFELDSQGRPVATKVYWTGSGSWRRVYNGMLGEIRGYTGNPETDFEDGGIGKAEKEYDGWALCDGRNGTPDLSDKFLIGAHMNNTSGHDGYGTSGWKTWASDPDADNGEGTGGESKTMIEKENLPPLDNRNADQITANKKEGLYIHGYGFKDDATHASEVVIVDVNYGNMHPHTVPEPIATYGCSPNGNPAVPQVEFTHLPPFYALAWIMFVGYST